MQKRFHLIVVAAFALGLFFLSSYSTLSIPTDELDCGFTQDFANFLKNNGYAGYQFDRPDIKCAAYGGRLNSQEKIINQPIIFIHGNSDIGFGRGKADGNKDWQTGFRSLATYFTSQGYKKNQLYTTTWGPANLEDSSLLYHKKQFVMGMRAFVQAVLKYTKAEKVNLISHSMGVTISRQIIKGGASIDHTIGPYVVGDSLKDKVNNFIGIAGGNLGLTACWTSVAIPSCNSKDGFFPGATSISGPSEYLNDLNKKGGAQGQNVYTIWSKFDDVIMGECLVWGKVTCRIPDQTAEIVKTTKEWGHLALRDNTGPDIIKWLQSK